MANNNVTIDTKLNTKPIEEGIKQIESGLTRMSGKVEKATKSLNSSMQEAFENRVPTDEYAELEKEFDNLANKMDVLRERQKRFLATGGKEKSSTYQRMEYDMRSLQDAQDVFAIKMARLEDEGRAFKSVTDADASAVKNLGNQTTATASKTNQMEKAQKKSNSTHKKGVKIFSALGNALKKQKSSLAGGFKTVLKYAFGIRSLFVLFNRLRNAMVEGFKNLAQFNNGLNPTNTALSNLMSAFTRLKNSMATAFAPLLTVVEPILTRLIDKVSDFANAVGMAFAKISGQKTFTKAVKVQQNYADSLDNTKKSAEETEKALAGYDKLEVVQQNKDSGSDSTSVTPNDMFQVEEVSAEETQIEKIIKKLLSVVQPIGDKLKDTFGLVVDAISQIAPPLLDIVNTILPPLLDIINALLPVITQLVMAVMPVIQSILTALMPIITQLVMSLLPIIQQVITSITPLLNVITNTILPVVVNLLNLLMPLIIEVIQLVADLLDPIIAILNPLLEIIVSVLEPIITIIIELARLMMASLKPALDLIVGVISGVMSPILNVLAGIIKEVMDIVTSVIKIITGKLIAGLQRLNPVIQSIVSVFKLLGTTISNVFSKLWNTVKPVLNKIIGGVEGLANKVIKAVNYIIGAINKIQFDVPDWVPVIGGKKFGFNLKEVSEVKIPRLAQGGVIPPNSEFLATLGDQKRGVNIETPLDTMIQAFKTALAEQGGTMPNEIKVVLPNGRVLAETVWDEEAKYYKQTGSYRPSMA